MFVAYRGECKITGSNSAKNFEVLLALIIDIFHSHPDRKIHASLTICSNTRTSSGTRLISSSILYYNYHGATLFQVPPRGHLELYREGIIIPELQRFDFRLPVLGLLFRRLALREQ